MMQDAARTRAQIEDARDARLKCEYFGLSPVDDSLTYLFTLVTQRCGFDWRPDGTVVHSADDFFAVYSALLSDYGIPCEGPPSSTTPPPTVTHQPESARTAAAGPPGGSRGRRSIANRCFRVLDADADGALRLADLVDLLFVGGHTSGLGQTAEEDRAAGHEPTEAEGGDRHRLMNVMSVRLSGDMAAKFEAHCRGGDRAAATLGLDDQGAASDLDVHMDRTLFSEAWRAATGAAVNIDFLDALYGERTGISLQLFMAVCMTDSTRHSRRPFAAQFCSHRVKVARSILGLLAYIPFLAIFIYFCLAGTEKRLAADMFLQAKGTLLEGRLPAYPVGYPVDCYRPGPDDMEAYGTDLTGPLIANSTTRSVAAVPCSYRDYLKDPFADIDNTDAVMDWLRDVLVPVLWHGKNGSSIRGELGTFADQLGHTVAVGAVKIRARRHQGGDDVEDYERYILRPAGNDDERAAAGVVYQRTHLGLGLAYETRNAINRSSFGPASTFDNATDSGLPLPLFDAFRYRTCAELNGSFTARTGFKTFGYDCDGFALVLPTSLQGYEAQAMLAGLARHGWYDRSVMSIHVETYLYNIDADVLVHFGALFETTGTGYIMTTSKIDPIAINHNTWSSPQGVLLICFGFLAVAWLVALIAEAISYALRKRATFGRMSFRGFLQGVMLYFRADVWHIHAMATIVACLASFALRALFYNNYPRLPDQDLYQSAYYPPFDNIVGAYNGLQAVDAISGFLVVLRILKYFQLVPALNAITSVIADSSDFLGAIGFIFLVIFSGFLLCFEVAYGNSLMEFNNAALVAMQLTFFAVGEADYDTWNGAVRYLTPLLFVAFQVLVIILLVNTVVVVFTDAFTLRDQSRLDVTATLDLLTTDHSTRFVRPRRIEWLRATSVVSELTYVAAKALNRLTWFFSRAEERPLVDRQLARLRAANPRTMWALMTDALTMLDRGSQGDALVGALTLAQLCSAGHLENVERGETFSWFDWYVEGAPPSPTWEMLVADFGGPLQADVMLRLFVLTPRGLLGLDPSVLLVDLLEYRREWRFHAAAYSPLPGAATINSVRSRYRLVRPWLEWATTTTSQQASESGWVGRRRRKSSSFGTVLRFVVDDQNDENGSSLGPKAMARSLLGDADTSSDDDSALENAVAPHPFGMVMATAKSTSQSLSS
jgi:hypothetical protein